MMEKDPGHTRSCCNRRDRCVAIPVATPSDARWHRGFPLAPLSAAWRRALFWALRSPHQGRPTA